MRIIFSFFILIYLIYAKDLDLDGVDDNIDKCLKTPFKYMVDRYGCIDDDSYYGSFDLGFSSWQYNNELKGYATTINYHYKQALISTSYVKLDTNNTDIKKDIFNFGLGYNIGDFSFYTSIDSLNINTKVLYSTLLFDTIYPIVSLEYIFDDTDYINYMFGIFLYGLEIDYINSGSLNNIINEYEDIDISYSYSYDIYYLFIGWIQDIKEQTNHTIYGGIRIEFE